MYTHLELAIVWGTAAVVLFVTDPSLRTIYSFSTDTQISTGDHSIARKSPVLKALGISSPAGTL